MQRMFLTGLTALALTACATQEPEHVARYSGTFTFGFETSAFRTDGDDGPWWLSAEGATWTQVVAPIHQAGGGPWGAEHLVVEAQLSPEGRYGHMGAYTRQIRVTRVIEARLISASPRPSDN